MNKISLYILLVLIFLGLSQSFSLSEKGTAYIKNKQFLGRFFEGTPLCVILVDAFQTGFLIKTFYHKYKVIYGFKQPREQIVRTSFEFYHENKVNIGLSIFRRRERSNIEEHTPMPPGVLFLGNPAYGQWVLVDSGEKLWLFHHAYRHFVRSLGWGSFRPTLDFYHTAKLHLSQDLPFYGLHNEFGSNGKITKLNFPEYFYKTQKANLSFGGFLKNIMKPKINWAGR